MYYYFHKWFKDGSFQKAWLAILQQKKVLRPLFAVTGWISYRGVAKQGGEAVGYQGRKKVKTANTLFLTNKNGLPLIMSEPQAGNHNDVYEIRSLFEQTCALLETAGISLKGVFMNADAGFDVAELQQGYADREIEANIDDNLRNNNGLLATYQYFNEELYRERFVIERTNAWLDDFKGLMMRYKKKIKSWMTQHFMFSPSFYSPI